MPSREPRLGTFDSQAPLPSTRTAGGSHRATLLFTDNFGNLAGRTQSVTLTGVNQTPRIALSATKLDFGTNSSLLGTLAPIRAVTSTATAPSALGIAGITGRDASNFAVASDTYPGSTQPPGAACTITLRFRALSPRGNKTAALTITSNAPAISVALKGRAAP